MEKRRYPLIDIIKVFCSGLVVLIHLSQIKEGTLISNIMDACFTRQAVPFFFIASGFFFGRKVYSSDNCVRASVNQAKKIFMLYIVWQILWIPFIMSTYISKYEGESIIYVGFILFRRLFIAGQGSYWYLLVLAETILVSGLCIKFHKEKFLYLIAAGGIFLGLLYDAEIAHGIIGIINNLFYIIFGWSNNLIMKGIPYVSLGILLSQKNVTLSKKMLSGAYILISIISVMFFFAANNGRMVLLYPIQAILLFLISIQATKLKIDSKTCCKLRNLSSTIYLVHMVYVEGVVSVFWPIDAPRLFRWSVTMLFSVLTYIIIEKLKIKPLMWLMSMEVEK